MPGYGAAAFLMAHFIGVQYSVIVFAAIIPAFSLLFAYGLSLPWSAARPQTGLKILEKIRFRKCWDQYSTMDTWRTL